MTCACRCGWLWASPQARTRRARDLTVRDGVPAEIDDDVSASITVHDGGRVTVLGQVEIHGPPGVGTHGAQATYFGDDWLTVSMDQDEGTLSI